jgi:hypothetical protein
MLVYFTNGELDIYIPGVAESVRHWMKLVVGKRMLIISLP